MSAVNEGEGGEGGGDGDINGNGDKDYGVRDEEQAASVVAVN